MQTENKLQMSSYWLSNSVYVVPPQVQKKSVRFLALSGLPAGFWPAFRHFDMAAAAPILDIRARDVIPSFRETA
jgi:hypothetical protein